MTQISVSRPALSRLWLAAPAAAGVAVGANILIWLLARALALPLDIQMGGPQSPVVPLTVAPVVIMSAVPALLAAGLLWLLGRFSARPFAIFQIVAVVVLLLSLAGPLSLPVGGVNKLVLGVMHVVAALTIVGTLRRMAHQP